METVVGEERGEGGSRMSGVVVAEFRQGEEAGPVGLLIVAVDAEVLFQDRIEPLRLAIRLGMESGGPICVDSQKDKKSAPEVGCEDRIAIADDVRWEAMNADDVLDEQSRHVGCRHRFCSRDEDCHLC